MTGSERTRNIALGLLIFFIGASALAFGSVELWAREWLRFGGLLTLGSAVAVHVLTLPTELDASFGRAMPLLKKQQVLYPSDERHARRLLQAAAMTYVSASLMSLLNIARWWAIIRR